MLLPSGALGRIDCFEPQCRCSCEVFRPRLFVLSKKRVQRRRRTGCLNLFALLVLSRLTTGGTWSGPSSCSFLLLLTVPSLAVHDWRLLYDSLVGHGRSLYLVGLIFLSRLSKGVLWSFP